MDWRTLLTAFAGALGGTVTALTIVGFFGKLLIDQWLKKDFKRFEQKIDALASRDETKFSYLHGERAVIVKEIYRRCNEIERNISFLLFARLVPRNIANELFEARRKELERTLHDMQASLIDYLSDKTIYFSVETIAVVISLCSFTYDFAKGTAGAPIDAIELQASFTKKLAAIETEFKELLGADIL